MFLEGNLGPTTIDGLLASLKGPVREIHTIIIIIIISRLTGE